MSEDKIHMLLSIDKIIEPENPVRSGVDQQQFEDLVQSIKDIGLIEPIVVKKVGSKYEVVAGHRRYLACKANGYQKISCMAMLKDTADADAIMIHENSMREDAKPLDEAAWFKRLMDKNGWSLGVMADKVKKSSSYVQNRLAMLEYPVFLLSAVESGAVSYSVARELAKIKDERQMEVYMNYAIDSGATQRVAEQWAKEVNQLTEIEAGTREEYEPTEVRSNQQADPAYPCAVCGKYHPWDETVVIRMCLPCKGEAGI